MTTSTVQPGMRAVMASPFTPIAVINGTPVYPIQGGRSGGGIQIFAGDDDGTPDDDLLDDADEDADDADDEDDEPDEEEDERPARRRKSGDSDDAMVRMEAALRKANSEAAKYRRAGKTMARLGIDDLQTWLTERGIDPETGLPFGDDVVDPDDTSDGAEEELFTYDRDSRRDTAKRDRETTRAIRAAEKRAESRAMEKLVPILAQTAATNALREAGFSGTPAQMDRILRMIDPNDLDVVIDEDTFEIDGLDEAIAGLRDDFPKLFEDEERPTRRRTVTKSTPARRASGARDVDGGERGRPAKKTGGWVDQVVAQWDKRGR